jgi:iron complex transport system substrate-binding protein
MPSPYENNGGYGRLEQMGIPIMECADYMEVSPLARAEWIKIYGSLFGVAAKADSLFNAIEAKYISLRDLTDRQEKKPRLLTERPFSGAWHVPGGESTTGQLYRDAGADYIFSDWHGTGARAISIEEVLNRASDADIWLIKSFGDVTKKDILKDMPLLRILPARLVVCNTDVVPFFEETPFHPEYLLENLIALFHPELGIVPEHEYFRVNEK